MADLDEILNGKSGGAEAELANTLTPEPALEPAASAAPEGGETPQAEDPPEGGQVPVGALQAERRERQDWKEKAIRLEEQLKAATTAQAKPPAETAVQRPRPDPVTDPDGYHEYQEAMRFQDRCELSEQMVRQQHPDAGEKIDAFIAATQQNPALSQQLRRQANPALFAYEQGKKILAMKDIGDDPAAYRTRLEAEIREKLAAESGAQPSPGGQPALVLPPNLSGMRSAAPRGATPFTGPTPIERLFPN